MNFGLFLVFSAIVSLGSCLQCFTCEGKCGCRDPVAEQCPARTKCYTLKSLTNGNIVRKGCAPDCISINQNDRFCEQCDSDSCNSEQSLVSMNGVDECRDQPSPFRLPRPMAYQAPDKNDIGSGVGYQPSNIGSGSQYNPNSPGIGSGSQYGGVGTGSQYNPNGGIGSGSQYGGGGIGTGSQYNPNGGDFGGIGSGANPNAPGGYYPSPNVGANDGETRHRGQQPGAYPYGSYNDRNNNGGLGTGAVPYYNSAELHFGWISMTLSALFAFVFVL
uniref:Uncharacterized protein n=1 Tax=Panagrellus redivivus TaxID=6233 RepID=A0A7E4UZE6_PANRE